jgi:hypothetical protein
MTPLEAIGYAFAAVIVSPAVLGLLILALMALLVLGVLIWESRKAQVIVLAGALLWFTVPPFVRWANTPSVAEPCSERCDVLGQSQEGRFICLEQCFKAEKLINENEAVRP